MRHLRANPAASLLLDDYAEDWSRLWWLRVDATARVVEPATLAADPEVAAVVAALRAKYPQYRARRRAARSAGPPGAARRCGSRAGAQVGTPSPSARVGSLDGRHRFLSPCDSRLVRTAVSRSARPSRRPSAGPRSPRAATSLIAAPDRLGQDARRVPALHRSPLPRARGDGELPSETEVVYVSPLKALSVDIQQNLEAPLREIAATAARARARGAGDPRARAHRRHAGRGARGDAEAPAAPPDHDARVALPAAHRRAQPRAPAPRAHGDRRRDPRAGARQARLAPGAHARAARRAVRSAARAHRPLGDAASDRDDRALAGRRGPRTHGRAGQARLRDRRRRPPPRARPRARRAGQRARGGRVERAVGRDPRRHRGAGREAPHDAGLRQHAAPGRAPRAPARRAARRRAGRRAPRQPVEGAPPARRGSGCERASCARSSRRRRSSSASTSAPSSSSARSARRAASRRCCSASAARATRAARVPKGRLFPTTRDELVECAALLRAVRAGRLDRVEPPAAPLDILAQQIVADCAAEDWREDALFALVRRAAPFAELVARGLRRGGRDALRGHRRPAAGGAARICTATASTACCAAAAARGSRRSPRAARSPRSPTTASSPIPTTPSSAPSTRTGRSRAWRATCSCSAAPRGGSAASRRASCASSDAQGAPPDDPVLARRGARAHGRALGRGLRAARRGRARCSSAATCRRALAWLERECGARRAAAEQVAALPRGGAHGARRRADSAGHRRSSASSTRRAACSSSCTRRSAGASTAPSGSRCASASARLRLRAAGRGHRRRDRALARPAAQLPARGRAALPLAANGCPRSLAQALLASPMFTARWRWNLERALVVLRMQGRQAQPAADPAHGGRRPDGGGVPRARRAARRTQAGPDRDPRSPAGAPDDARLPARGDGRRRARGAARARSRRAACACTCATRPSRRRSRTRS